MPFDALPTDLSSLSNLEILALAESRPGRHVLLALETIMVTRIADAVLAKPGKRIRRQASAETKALRLAQKQRREALKTPAQYIFGAGWEGVSNPLYECRFAALCAQYGKPEPHDYLDGYVWFNNIALSTVSAGVWTVYDDNQTGDTVWAQWSRDDRDALTDAGRDLALPMIAARRDAALKIEEERRQAQAINAAKEARRLRIETAPHVIAIALNEARKSRQPMPAPARKRRGRPSYYQSQAYRRELARKSIARAWEERRFLRAALKENA